MKVKEIQIIKSILEARIGWSWPIVLLRAMIRRKAVLGKTHWSSTKDPESEFVQRISVASALYLELGRMMGRDESFEVMEELLVSIGCSEQWDHLNSMDMPEEAGMERLMAFNNLMDQKGASRFNRREYVRRNESICHFQITRCIFKDFFSEAGTPELTKLFCEVDRRFFPEAFPQFRFHRGGSWENTIAYGNDNCEFVFQKRGTCS